VLLNWISGDHAWNLPESIKCTERSNQSTREPSSQVIKACIQEISSYK
jgi:hypothetical protein